VRWDTYCAGGTPGLSPPANTGSGWAGVMLGGWMGTGSNPTLSVL